MLKFKEWTELGGEPTNEAQPNILRRMAGGAIGGLSKGVGAVLKAPGAAVSAAGEALGKAVRGSDTGVDAWLAGKEKSLNDIEDEVTTFLTRIKTRIEEYDTAMDQSHRDLYIRPDIEVRMTKDRDNLQKLLNFAQGVVGTKLIPYIQALKSQLEGQKAKHRTGGIFTKQADFGTAPKPPKP